jgi:hypothetical protein
LPDGRQCAKQTIIQRSNDLFKIAHIAEPGMSWALTCLSRFQAYLKAMQRSPISHRKSLALRLLGGALGAVATLTIGFYWGGWVTGGSARAMAQKSVDTALVAALAPICVDRFQESDDAAENLLALKKVSVWRQGTFISNGGWAAMPDGDTTSPAVADACATRLTGVKWR